MKLTTMLLFASILFFANCNRIFHKATDNNPHLQFQPIVIKNKNLKDYLYYASDSEMTNMNNIMYAYLSGIQKVIMEKPALLKLLFDKTKAPYQNGIFLIRFIAGSGQCKASFNKFLAPLFPESVTTDHSMALARGMLYKGISYEPAVALYNAKNARMETEYYLALLVEPGENTDSNKEYIPAYHYKNGTIQLELLDALETYYQPIPVFVFGFETNKDQLVPGTKSDYFLAPKANPEDTETFNPADPVALYHNPSMKYIAPPVNPIIPLIPQPSPGTVQSESANLYAHHEQYGDSEYAISYRVSYSGGSSAWIEHETIKNVSRQTVDCGCYVSIDQEFIYNTNTGQVFSFLTFEKDGWIIGHRTLQSGTVTFRYRAREDTDIYVYSANASTNVDFPGTPPVAKTYNNINNAQHVFRRY